MRIRSANGIEIEAAPLSPSFSPVHWKSASSPTTQFCDCQLRPAWMPPSQPSTCGSAVLVNPVSSDDDPVGKLAPIGLALSQRPQL
jgi:hypothetical protein